MEPKLWGVRIKELLNAYTKLERSFHSVLKLLNNTDDSAEKLALQKTARNEKKIQCFPIVGTSFLGMS